MKTSKIIFTNKDSVEIRGEVSFGDNVRIGSHVIFEEKVSIGNDVVIGDFVKINNSTIDSSSEIKDYTLIDNAEIGSGCFIGPYARVRPETKIANNCQIGNFVELKNSTIGRNCRINHMAFIGDALLEDDVTVGAGTITCNHNGLNVNKTIISKGAYIGSNVNLIAPVSISENATIGSGSTITKNAPANKLTIARSKQILIEGWKRPK